MAHFKHSNTLSVNEFNVFQWQTHFLCEPLSIEWIGAWEFYQWQRISFFSKSEDNEITLRLAPAIHDPILKEIS